MKIVKPITENMFHEARNFKYNLLVSYNNEKNARPKKTNINAGYCGIFF